MKPFLNLDELEEYEPLHNEPFLASRSVISSKLGARKLAYNVVIVPPGKKVWPFHNHHVNEELFLILAGTGTLRFGDQVYPIKKNDVIACPPGGREVAHQIINTSEAVLRYLCISTNEFCEICEYPDSNKVLTRTGTVNDNNFRHVSRIEDSVDYFHGES